ncbi:MAG TPA: hypothetical protein VFO55_01900 [Gemmatimonadaceae bacterium]|nr:hypothetical protein [Gemmatimonadaceae bacterium]
MRHGRISRNLAKAFFAFVTLGMAAACADSNVAPTTAEAPAFKAPANFNTVVGTVIFRVYNSEGAVQRLGDHVIYLPAGAICDPLLSTYGSTEWDKPCTPLIGGITITATMMRDNENHPYVDFQPALRFAPDKNVMLFLRNGLASRATQLNIEYCNNLGFCIDESINDPSLRSFRVGSSSIIGRRIKHFSGYVVAVGEPCEGTLTQEPDGTWMCWTETLQRRSGYMVASGLDAGGEEKDEDKVGKREHRDEQ